MPSSRLASGDARLIRVVLADVGFEFVQGVDETQAGDLGLQSAIIEKRGPGIVVESLVSHVIVFVSNG